MSNTDIDTKWLPGAWRYRTSVLVLCTAVYFGVRLGTAALTALETRIVADLQITYGLFGLAVTGSSIMSALMQLPSGALSDQYGERKIIFSATVLAGVGAILLALATTYTMFISLTIFIGIGGGLYYSPSTTLLDRLYNETGQAIGAFRIGGQVAGVVAPILVGVIAVHFGWRSAIAFSGLLLLPVASGLLLFMQPTNSDNTTTTIREQLAVGTLTSILLRPRIAVTTILASLIQFVDVASFTFLPAILHEVHGLSTRYATVLYGGYFAVVTVAQPLVGRLSDRVGRTPVTGGTLLAGISGYGLLTLELTLVGEIVAVCLAGLAMTWATPVQARFVDLLQTEEQGTGFGLVRTLYLLIGALGSVVIGAVATQLGWVVALKILVGILCSCLVLILAITRIDRRLTQP